MAQIIKQYNHPLGYRALHFMEGTWTMYRKDGEDLCMFPIDKEEDLLLLGFKLNEEEPITPIDSDMSKKEEILHIGEQEKETNDWIASGLAIAHSKGLLHSEVTREDIELIATEVRRLMPTAQAMLVKDTTMTVTPFYEEMLKDYKLLDMGELKNKVFVEDIIVTKDVTKDQVTVCVMGKTYGNYYLLAYEQIPLPTEGNSREVDEIIEDFRNGSKSYSLLRKNIIDYVAKTVGKTSAEYACLGIEKILPTASNEVADDLYVDGLAEIIAKKTEGRLTKHPKIDKSYFPALVKSITKEVLSELLPHTTVSTPLK